MRYVGKSLMLAAICTLGCESTIAPDRLSLLPTTISAPAVTHQEVDRLEAQASDEGKAYLIAVASCSLRAVHGEVIPLEAQVIGTDEEKKLKWKAIDGEVTEAGIYTAPDRDTSDTVTVWAEEDPSISDTIQIAVGPKPTLNITSAGFFGCSYDPRYTCGVQVTWTSTSPGPDTFEICLLSGGTERDCTTYGSSGGHYTTSVSISRGTFGTPLYTPNYVRVRSTRYPEVSVTKAL